MDTVRLNFEKMLTPVILELEEASQHEAEILRLSAALFDDSPAII